MELKNINQIDKAAKANRYELFRFGTALFFIVCIMLYIELQPPVEGSKIMLVIAAMIGGYMALNIGANDVANAMGTNPNDATRAVIKTGRSRALAASSAAASGLAPSRRF